MKLRKKSKVSVAGGGKKVLNHAALHPRAENRWETVRGWKRNYWVLWILGGEGSGREADFGNKQEEKGR